MYEKRVKFENRSDYFDKEYYIMRNKTSEYPFNILSIDGGGIRGLMPALFLR